MNSYRLGKGHSVIATRPLKLEGGGLEPPVRCLNHLGCSFREIAPIHAPCTSINKKKGSEQLEPPH